MIVPSLEELNSFKYSDLQNLAKSLGLRANLRSGWSLLSKAAASRLLREHLAPLSVFLPLLILILWLQIPFSVLYLHE